MVQVEIHIKYRLLQLPNVTKLLFHLIVFTRLASTDLQWLNSLLVGPMVHFEKHSLLQ